MSGTAESARSTGRTGVYRSLALAGVLCAIVSAFATDAAHAAHRRNDPETPKFLARYREAEHAFLTAALDKVRSGKWPLTGHLLDPEAAIRATDRDATDIVLRRTRSLLNLVSTEGGSSHFKAFEKQLARLEAQGRRKSNAAARKALFMRVVELRRRIAFANPVLDFDRIIFMNAAAPYTGHVSGIGPVASNKLAWSSNRGRKAANKYPYHLGNGRIAYMMDDWYHPPSGREGADWIIPRFRSKLFARTRGPKRERGPAGLLALSGFKDNKPRVRPLLKGTKVTAGPNKGAPLSDGVFAHDWDLDFDGKRAVFCWVHRRMPNIYIADFETREVRQLTDTVWGDFNPIFLPNGRIVFRSSRRFVIDRCQPWDHEDYTQRHCATPYSMKDDGTDQIPISWHETNEAHPIVDNDGKLVFTRWDYIDRGFNEAQHMWHSFPDGRDPRSFHGNYKQPYYPKQKISKQEKKKNWLLRPVGEFHCRPLPNTSGRYLAMSSGHHNIRTGNPVIININIPDDGGGAQVKQIIDGIGIGTEQSGGAGFSSPYPLSESFYLVALNSKEPQSDQFRRLNLPEITPDDGLFLLDRFGNLEPLVTDAAFGKHGKPTSYSEPFPLKARTRPPVIPEGTWQGERRNTPGHKRATLAVMNVYDSDFEWPEGRKPTSLRVVRLWGRPWARPGGHYPEIGYCKGSVGRMSMGTAPIEPDGSVYVEAPVECQIYFQVLDQKGMAIQSMRSGTYIHPGEQMTCAGCHEDKWNPGRLTKMPMALQRAPSKLKPEPGGVYPQTFARLVEPLFEDKCVSCHKQQGKGLKSMGYFDLRKKTWHYGNGGLAGHSKYSRSAVGDLGAASSHIGRALMKTHENRLTEEERRRVYLWLDLNSGCISDYMHEEEQTLGRIVWPWEARDMTNPLQIEYDRPLAKNVVPPDGLPAVLTAMDARDWQRRQAAYEALRQLGSKAARASRDLEEAFSELMESDQIEETQHLLRAVRYVDAKTYGKCVADLAEVARGEDSKRAFAACQVLRFLGDASPEALATFAHCVRSEDYDLAQAAAEALVGLGEKARPVRSELVRGLTGPYPRVVAMVAKVLGRLGPDTRGAVAGLTKVLAERSRDFTWLGKDDKELAKVPAVVARHKLLTGRVYENADKWGERQSAILVAACNVERGWERKMATACARALGQFGQDARSALPALAHCASLDAADLPALVNAAARIDLDRAIEEADRLLKRQLRNEDRAVRLVSFIGLLAERLPASARSEALSAMRAAMAGPGEVARDAKHWHAVLQGKKPPKRGRKR